MKLTIKNQCEISGISRSAYYYKPEPTANEEEIRILKAIMEELNLRPFYEYKKITVALKDMNVTRKQIRLIMRKAGLRAIYPGKRLSEPNKHHEKYPYLLRYKSVWTGKGVPLIIFTLKGFGSL